MAAPASAPSFPGRTTVDPEEVARFDAMASDWWDPDGPFRPLHRLNPLRIAYIRDEALKRQARLADGKAPDPRRALKPLAGLRVLDIGCGGGLLAEPMARLGAEVVGVDAAERNIAAARAHAQAMALDIDYRHSRAEELARAGERFDLVLAMEIIEHVADAGAFLEACGRLLVPGGMLAIATLNRTARSYALAILGAEYLLRWLPRGTHDWRRFLRPHELAHGLREAGLALDRLDGARYDPFEGTWSLVSDLSVNYMAIATRPAA